MQNSRSLARPNIFPENPSSLLPLLPLALASLPPTPLLFDYLPTHLVCPSPPQPPSVLEPALVIRPAGPPLARAVV